MLRGESCWSCIRAQSFHCWSDMVVLTFSLEIHSAFVIAPEMRYRITTVSSTWFLNQFPLAASISAASHYKRRRRLKRFIIRFTEIKGCSLKSRNKRFCGFVCVCVRRARIYDTGVHLNPDSKHTRFTPGCGRTKRERIDYKKTEIRLEGILKTYCIVSCAPCRILLDDRQ